MGGDYYICYTCRVLRRVFFCYGVELCGVGLDFHLRGNDEG